MTCARAWEARAIDEGRLGPADVEAFDRHTRACSACRDELAALARLRTLGQRLAAAGDGGGPSELDLRRLRGRVLRDAMSASSSSPRALTRARTFAVALAAVAGVALVVVRAAKPSGSVPAPRFAAVVTPSPVAVFSQARDGALERVVLSDGDVTLQVRKQGAGERFLVEVPDGEVEVRGTTFEMSVHDGRTARVHVDTGVVVVRIHGESVLSAGDSWPAEVVVADDEAAKAALPAVPTETPAPVERPADVAPAVARRAPQPRLAAASAAHAKAAAPVDETDDETAEYDRAIDAFRLGRFEQAAGLLRAFVAAHPRSGLLDDASFVEAACRASAGQGQAAAQLAEAHMKRFPDSFHREDAAVLVARARRDAGDCAGARGVLAPWLTGGKTEPRLATALGRCLEER